MRIGEEVNDPWTLTNGLFNLGHTHLRRGNLHRAIRDLERSLDLSRNWQIVVYAGIAAATLGAAYAFAGRADEALPLVAEAVEEFRERRPAHVRPAFVLLCAGLTHFVTGRIDEAAGHAREALALARRARGARKRSLCPLSRW